MYFQQIMTPGLGCFSYCIGCPQAGGMVVIDPKRDILDYLDIARDEGMRITHIINTHLHADHVSGEQELRAATGAEIYMYEGSPVTFPFRNLREGDMLQIGAARLQILHTPGHTPHSISILVTDTQRSPEPQLMLTGDLLFVGDTGRPDLAGEDLLEEQTRNLYMSLYEKLRNYPDYLEIFPAHGQGSLCGKGMSSKRSSTLGYERKANPMLQYSSFESFRAAVLEALPSRPKSFTHIIATNARGADLLEACTLDRALSVAQFSEAMATGAVIIDSREAEAFGGGHIPGSINIGLEKQLANWVGMVVSPDAELLLVTANRRDYEHMLIELRRIGYDRVLGYLSGGIKTWILSGRPVAQLAQLSCVAVQQGVSGILLDVRTNAEWESGHLRGARHIPLADLLNGMLPEIDRKDNIVVYCRSGFRSNIAGSILARAGFINVQSMAGGVTAWENAGYLLEH
ncbi:MAG: MBL fold metallo-hydrolase [bacterium]|nr:MBL fold metallo-hydrolase [bacterium]